jgi:hypothetical protein
MKTILNLVWVFSLSVVIAPLVGLAQSAALMTTITNPTPAASDYFGYSVAAVGTDRVLIGAYSDNTGATDAGAAYLLRTNGTLLATIPNPAPAAGDYFGWCVATGGDWLAVSAMSDDQGASGAGTVYLFSTNGTRFATITNPAPAASDAFGSAVAAAADWLVIGAAQDDQGATDAGTAYLYRTNGTLLTTITNPSPSTGKGFGDVVAAAADWVVVACHADSHGASWAGTVYLFGTNGTLFTTITNPTPASSDHFGISVAVLGSDRVLIGAYLDDTGATDAGAAYLFSTNGTLLTTCTNPTPANADYFGVSVAAVGTDRVLIGAYRDDAGATDTGVAYLFITNGALLTTLTNPAPAANDWFGRAVAATPGWLVVGASEDSAGAAYAGTAYLYALETPGAPALRVASTPTNSVAVSWPSPSTGWELQQNTNSVSSVNWSNVTDTIQDDGKNKALIVQSPLGSRFYRLHKP